MQGPRLWSFFHADLLRTARPLRCLRCRLIGGNWSGTYGFEGVRLIRLCCLLLWYPARTMSHWGSSPIKVLWNMCCFSSISFLFQEMTWSFYHYCCTSDLRGGSTAEGCTGRAGGTSWVVWACFLPKLPLPKCYASAWGCVQCVKIDVMLFFLLTQ